MTRRSKTFRRQRAGAVTIPADPVEAAQFFKNYAEQAINAHTLPPPTILNPESKFVVVTYWWGRGVVNVNTGRPCAEDIKQRVRDDLESDFIEYSPSYQELSAEWVRLKKLVTGADGQAPDLSPPTLAAWRSIKKKREDNIIYWDQDPDFVNLANNRLKPAYFREPSAITPITMERMIDGWVQMCRDLKLNFLVQEYDEFHRRNGPLYQAAINAKPLFIKKALEACGGRAVVYIDGDMFFRKYPAIFDTPNVDFMCQGWNCDPRTSPKVKNNDVCFDPYILETSGGIMYYAPTPSARALLDMWWTETTKPEVLGKADDRVLSQVFTRDRWVLRTNIIQLPLEYLWLTDKYTYFNPAGDVGNRSDCIVEHPACLTAEEAAAEQGASSNRFPPGYKDDVEKMVICGRMGGVFYEYIFFPDVRMTSAFFPYLEYMKRAKNNVGDPMFVVVGFNDKYGPTYNKIAEANLKTLETMAIAVSQTPGQTASLPPTATIRQIMFHLKKGVNVKIGEPGEPESGVEFIATNSGQLQPVNYLADMVIDVTRPMFISASNPVIYHMLAMCTQLSDINIHLRQSYLFLSRIRWSINIPTPVAEMPVPVPEVPVTPPPQSPIPKVLHQIWFGSEVPHWRIYLFELNEIICKTKGYKYKLWRESDRTEENFPVTYALQQRCIEIGRQTGQSRWAQVADLARLELIHKDGGIYMDSLFETSPAFFDEIDRIVSEGALFIGCNEDPCGLECRSESHGLYLTNSFFAAKPGSEVLTRLLDPATLSAIDLNSEFINRTTGPYYLRKGIVDPQADHVVLIDTWKMYPFNKQATPYRPEIPNVCLKIAPSNTEPGFVRIANTGSYLRINCIKYLTDNAATLTNIQQHGVPLAIYHSGLGGTWST